MQDRQGEHAVLCVAEEAPDARRPDFSGLQVEQTRNHLEIVLHPVMDLTKHVVALLDIRAQRGLAAGDRFRHRAHTGGHRSHLRDQGRDGDSTIFSPRATLSAKSWM